MAKFSVNLPDGYDELLGRWAEDLGDKKGSLAAQLIKLCLEKRFPNELPGAPEVMPGDPLGTLRIERKIGDQFLLALNLNEGSMSSEAFIGQTLKGHFARWREDYDSRILYFSRSHKLSWEQAYTLLTGRIFPYSEEDIAWAKEQPARLSRSEFLKEKPRAELGKDLAAVRDEDTLNKESEL